MHGMMSASVFYNVLFGARVGFFLNIYFVLTCQAICVKIKNILSIRVNSLKTFVMEGNIHSTVSNNFRTKNLITQS